MFFLLYLFGSSAHKHICTRQSKQYLLKHSALPESLNSRIQADLLIRDFGDADP